MYCSNCNKTIKTTDTICPDCGSDLTDVIPEDGYFRLEAMKPVKLTTVVNNYDADIILNLLKNNDIPCLKKDKFVGGYMNILMGYSVYGQDIYVDERDYENALELLQILEPINESEESIAPTSSEADDSGVSEAYVPDQADEEAPAPAFFKNQTIVARFILGFMVAGTIVALIINSL